MNMARELGYVTWFRAEKVGNLSGLFRAIADGEVGLTRSWTLTDSQTEYTTEVK